MYFDRKIRFPWFHDNRSTQNWITCHIQTTIFRFLHVVRSIAKVISPMFVTVQQEVLSKSFSQRIADCGTRKILLRYLWYFEIITFKTEKIDKNRIFLKSLMFSGAQNFWTTSPIWINISALKRYILLVCRACLLELIHALFWILWLLMWTSLWSNSRKTFKCKKKKFQNWSRQTTHGFWITAPGTTSLY